MPREVLSNPDSFMFPSDEQPPISLKLSKSFEITPLVMGGDGIRALGELNVTSDITSDWAATAAQSDHAATACHGRATCGTCNSGTCGVSCGWQNTVCC